MAIENLFISQSKDKNKKERTFPDSFFFLLLVFLAAVRLDQFSKMFVFAKDSGLRNYVFAFSLPLPLWLIYLIYALVLLGLTYYLFNNHSKFSLTIRLAWTLIFAGAASNIAERIFLGYVRDFIHIFNGVLNFADFYILIGIFILVLPEFKSKPEHI